MADILKPKRGKRSTIERINPLLQEGEIVLELPENEGDAGVIKIGDGVTRYNDLPAFIRGVANYISSTEKGAANGVAPLNENRQIDSTYLPSYTDDVLEFDSFFDFPNPGETGKIYVDTSATSNNTYRWSGTQYIKIAGSVTYELVKSGSAVVLEGSDGSHSTVNNVGGVEIRTEEPSHAELYPGKMWVVNR